MQHLLHLLHFLAHCLHLLVGRLQCRIVLVRQQLGVNSLGKPCGHFLRARPVHVLDKQVAGHSPQLRVALQQLAHSVERFLPLRHVARANSHRNVVLADIGVVNLFNNNTLLVLNLLDRHRLRRVDHGLVGFAVHADNPRNALGVVDFRYQIDQLPCCVTNSTGQVVNIMVGAGVGLLFPRQNSPPRAFVAGGA